MKYLKTKIFLLIIVSILLIFFLSERNVNLYVGIPNIRTEPLNCKIIVDNKIVFDSLITDNPFVYENIHLKKNVGYHSLKLIVADKILTDTTFLVFFNQYIVIEYLKNNNIFYFSIDNRLHSFYTE